MNIQTSSFSNAISSLSPDEILQGMKKMYTSLSVQINRSAKGVTMSSSTEKPKFTPAYCSFKSFNSFFDARREDGHVTDVVDRSLMTNFAGSTASELLAALKYLGMTDDRGTPRPLYGQYVLASDEERVGLLEKALRSSYPYLLNTDSFNVERATSQQVVELFRAQGISGSTLARAMIFFLAAAKQAGIKVSPNIRPPGVPIRIVRAKKENSPPAVPPSLALAQHVEPRASHPTGVQVFEIPIPIGRKVSIAIPDQFSSADWELFQTMLTAYVQHWKAQMAETQNTTATIEKEADGAL
jgi:Family of unknown function (DUF5343)